MRLFSLPATTTSQNVATFGLDYPYSFYFSIFSVQGPFQSPLQPRLPQRQAWSVDRITDSFRERHAYAYAFKALKSRNSLVYLS